MKKLLPISLVINALLIIGAALMIFGPVMGGTFSRVNSTLSGGAPQESYAEAPQALPSSGNFLGFNDLLPTAPEALILTDQAVSNSGSTVPAAQIDRIVIKNADLAIVVSDVNGRLRDIQDMAQQMGGFVVSSNVYKSYTNNNIEVPEGQIVIRVPAEKLGDALAQIKKDTVDVQNENVSGQDVTSEYVDLQSRLKNLEDAEAQLNEIMKGATDTTDVVTIFNQLVSYREQIEVIKGQIKYYDEAAALSAISVRVIAEETVQPVVIGKWEPKGAALEAIQDLINFLQNFTEFAIRFVIYILPSLIVVGLALYVVYVIGRIIFRKFNKSSPEQGKLVSKYIEINSTEIDKLTDVGELEQKIKEGESLLSDANASSIGVWAPLTVSFGIVIYLFIKLPTSGIYLIMIGFGLVYLGFNIWRLYSSNKQKREIESKLSEYRARKEELQERSVEKK